MSRFERNSWSAILARAWSFPWPSKGCFAPHYVTWSEQLRIEFHGPKYLANIVRIITESGLRIYKELMPMRKENVDLDNAVGIAEVPLTPLAIGAFERQMAISGDGPFLFPNNRNSAGHHKNLRKTWQRTLARAQVPYFRIYDLRSTYATRLSAGGVADEWVTQMLRQGDSQVFKKYSLMKLQMKRQALDKINRRANGNGSGQCTHGPTIGHSQGAITSFVRSSCTVEAF